MMHFIAGFLMLVLAFGLFPRVALMLTVLGGAGVGVFVYIIAHTH